MRDLEQKGAGTKKLYQAKNSCLMIAKSLSFRGHQGSKQAHYLTSADG